MSRCYDDNDGDLDDLQKFATASSKDVGEAVHSAGRDSAWSVTSIQYGQNEARFIDRWA